MSDPPTLVVHRGKGRKDRRLPLTDSAAAALSDWVSVRGDFPGKLFVPISKGGRIAGSAMAPHALYKVLRKRTRQAGVDKLSPENLHRGSLGPWRGHSQS